MFDWFRVDFRTAVCVSLVSGCGPKGSHPTRTEHQGPAASSVLRGVDNAEYRGRDAPAARRRGASGSEPGNQCINSQELLVR